MDLRALRYFVATAEELNITRAAEKLHMSQPPLSHQLHLLEEELGAPLFLRGHRRLQLTPEGELLLRRARQLLDAVALTEQGAGVSIFPQATLTPNQLVVSKVIVDPPRRAEYVLVWSRRHRPGPLAGEFIRYVQSLAPEPIPLPQAPLLEA